MSTLLQFFSLYFLSVTQDNKILHFNWIKYEHQYEQVYFSDNI